MFEIIICDDDSACLEQTNQLVNDWIETASVPVTVKTQKFIHVGVFRHGNAVHAVQIGRAHV